MKSTKSFLSGITVLCMIVGLLLGSAIAAAGEVPIPNANLQLWLRADAGVVTADGASVTVWQDQSGNGNHAIAEAGTEPTLVPRVIGDLPGVEFATESFLRVPHKDELNAGESLTFFAVYRNGSGNRLLQKKSGEPVSEDSWFVIATQGLSVSGKYRDVSPTLYPGNRDDIYVVSHVFNAATGTIDMYRAGDHVWRIEDVPAQVPNEDDVFIGKRDLPGGNESGWRGILFEMIIYNTALDDEARVQVEQYLIDKYL